MLKITSDLICASELGKLGRVKFAQVFKSDRADP
jgi:hypothetical protein